MEQFTWLWAPWFVANLWLPHTKPSTSFLLLNSAELWATDHNPNCFEQLQSSVKIQARLSCALHSKTSLTDQSCCTKTVRLSFYLVLYFPVILSVHFWDRVTWDTVWGDPKRKRKFQDRAGFKSSLCIGLIFFPFRFVHVLSQTEPDLKKKSLHCPGVSFLFKTT